MSDDARRRILDRIREANAERDRPPHPGAFPGAHGDLHGGALVRRFARAVEAAGGEVVELADEGAAARWIENFAGDFGTAVVSPRVGDALDPGLPSAPASEAELGVSRAVGGAADTGTVLLSSGEGRSLQLLPPTHLVFLDADDLHGTLTAALEAARTRPSGWGPGTRFRERDRERTAPGSRLPAAIALHSGPSKSADIGRIVVTGVHGPGRLVVALVGAPRGASSDGPAERGDGPRSASSGPGDASSASNETEPGAGP